jgi:hypothetical protein
MLLQPDERDGEARNSCKCFDDLYSEVAMPTVQYACDAHAKQNAC